GRGLLDARGERAVLAPVPQDAVLDLREPGGRRDAASVLVKVPWVAHRVLLVARPMLSREDDAPGVRPGGTAVPPRLPPAPAARSGRPLVVEAVTGPPVRFY